MQYDVIPDLPQMDQHNFHQEDQHKAINEFKTSRRKFMFYENEHRIFNFFFENLDEQLYAGFVVAFSRQDLHTNQIFDYMKLLLEGVRLIRHKSKKSLGAAIRVENYIKSSRKI